MPNLPTFLRGLALLRYPEVVHLIGEARLRNLELARLREEAPEASLSNGVIVLGHRPGLLCLEAGATISEGTVLAFGDQAGGFGSIRVGARTWVGQYNNLRASEGGDIVIGADCLISQFCTLVGTQHARASGTPIASQGPDGGPRGIRIGDDVWLGAGVVVTPGVSIEDGAVVGANAVVTRNIPAGEIWAGVPAVKISERNS